MKKITVEVDEELLKRAQKASGEGVTLTVRKGLEHLANHEVYQELLALEGKLHLEYDIEELRRDRR